MRVQLKPDDGQTFSKFIGAGVAPSFSTFRLFIIWAGVAPPFFSSQQARHAAHLLSNGVRTSFVSMHILALALCIFELPLLFIFLSFFFEASHRTKLS
jgi:hypothetical protein